jgi:transketolase
MLSDQALLLKSFALRRRMLQLIHAAGAGHTGGGLSCLDILNVLYNRILRITPETTEDPLRDRYVQSKGHCVEALYAVMSDRGYFPDAALDTVCHYKSYYVGHPTRKIKGMEMNTGALGHGLPICLGMALAAKQDAAAFRVYTLLGDGELAEGSNWEAAMAAAHYKLDNLVAILDHNTLQITGHTKDVMSNEPLADKWVAFGWEVRSVNGHDYAALTTAITTPHPGKPLIVIANTVKGKGVSFMENVGKWHHGVPTDAELAQAITELDSAAAKLQETLK